jgi:alkanesulfonate monooxygenase SsuD/methylene tetrahydromethanopterin reductase-like flavin-dependent oxidoreductase (luciferase family)
MRFDMRAPETGAPATSLYPAALDMAAWGESHGCAAVLLCEHHGAADGYLPSPLVLATAMAARTSTLRIVIAVVQLPLYDPVRLAEDMAVLDIISNGRVSYFAAVGYRPAEYEMHGVDFRRRGKVADEKLGVLLQAKAGEPFEHEGRRIHVTPSPVTPGGPSITWGGGSVAAARRAGRFGLPFNAYAGGPELAAAYAEAARGAGLEPGPCQLPKPGPVIASNTFVARDVDSAWAELGPYLLYDARAYAAWNEGLGTPALSSATTVQELRAERHSHQVLTVDEAAAQVGGGDPLRLHPLIGGLPPGVAWPYLETAAAGAGPAAR